MMQSIKNQNGLYRKKDRYYFRRALPNDLKRQYNLKEIKKALKNHNYYSSKRMAALLYAASEELFDIIRLMQPSDDDLRFLVRNYFEKVLIDEEHDAWEDMQFWKGEDFPEELLETHDGLGPLERLEQINEGIATLQELAITGKYNDTYKEIAKILLEWKGFQYFEHSPHSQKLRRQLLEADIEARRIILAFREGRSGEIDIRHPSLQGCRNFLIEPDIDILEANAGKIYYEDIKNSPEINTLIPKYINFISDKNRSSSGLEDIRKTLELMTEVMGATKRIKEISNDDCRKLRDLIAAMPAHYSKRFKSKGLSLQDVINGKEKYEKVSPRTREKYWNWIKAFFSWCLDEGYITTTPLGNIKVQSVKASIEDRDPFSDAELHKFFHSPQYVGHQSDATRYKPGKMIIKDGKYWIPLVGLHTGMRLGEIITLRLSDIQYQDNIPFFDVNDDDEGKSVKNRQSVRKVPIHPDLVKIGFIDFVDQKRKHKKAECRVFDDISIPAKGTASLNFSKYFARYLKNIGLKHDDLTFHSFRHNFVQGMRDARIDVERMDALDGRKTGFKEGSNTRRNYGRAFEPKDLYPEMCKISFNLDLSHLN